MKWQATVLSPKEQNKIIDKVLREHYRDTMERKRVPSDYLLMFTEGGESNAVADAIAKAQARNTFDVAYKQAIEDNTSALTTSMH